MTKRDRQDGHIQTTRTVTETCWAAYPTRIDWATRLDNAAWGRTRTEAVEAWLTKWGTHE